MAFAACALVAGCGIATKTRQPAAVEEGVASWYGPGFHGRRTATGERFDGAGLSAAHRSLPLGSRVRVTNIANGRSIAVRINDRGPFVRGRVIDLSYGAARALGIVQRGTAAVRIERLGPAPVPRRAKKRVRPPVVRVRASAVGLGARPAL